MLTTSLFAKCVLALSAVSAAAGFANPEPCSGACWTHDPAVVRRSSDGAYFRFATGSGIGIWKAGDLSGPWEYKGAVLPSGSKINLAGNKDCWAPDVHLVGDTYMLYYAVSNFGSQSSAIGYATSPNLEPGSWTDHGATGVASSQGKPYNAIDPNLIQSGSEYYLNFGSFWDDIFQTKLRSDATGVDGSTVHLARNASGTRSLEGSYVHYRDGHYYLLFSSGVCCGYDKNRPAAGDEYKIYVCRSDSVTGPYVDRNGRSCLDSGGTLLLGSHDYVYGPGGQGLFSDPKYGTVLYYHYADTRIGLSDADYQFGWNRVGWSGGWPSV